VNRRIVYDGDAEQRPIGDRSRTAFVCEDGPASINGFRAGVYSSPPGKMGPLWSS